MATLEQEETQRQSLAKILAELAVIKPDDLVREDVLGRDLGFASGLPYFQRTLRLFRDLAEANLDTVPFTRLQQLARVAEGAMTQFQQVKNFSLQQSPQNPTQVRDTLVQQIRDSFDNHFDLVAPVIAYSVRKGTDFERLEDEARQTVETLKSLVADQEQSRKAMLAEVEGTLEKVRRAAQEVGVAQHAVHFRQEADEHKRVSVKWLVATGLLAIVTVLFGVLSLVYYISQVPTLTTGQSVQLALAKLVIFTVLFSTVIWSGRIYRAHRHNYIVNKHRQNALSTFETFVKAAGDDQTRALYSCRPHNASFRRNIAGTLPRIPKLLDIHRSWRSFGERQACKTRRNRLWLRPC